MNRRRTGLRRIGTPGIYERLSRPAPPVPLLAADRAAGNRKQGTMNMADSSKTVLLVEDNEDNRTVYRTILEHFGYRVTEARNGEDGVRMAREERPDLILMDISIPLIDGWEATRILKNDADTSHIPIIALTAHALATDRAKAQEVGCDGYLAKPCEPRRVVAEVEKFIGAGREREATA
jgi:CheY-like chemotaxis protein